MNDVKAFERRVASVQASWTARSYAAATSAEEMSVFVAAYLDKEIPQARRAVQQPILEYGRCGRGMQGMYDKMKAKEPQRWGGRVAA